MLIAFICSFLGFALLPLILMKKDLEELRLQREKDEAEEDAKRKERREERRRKREEFKNGMGGSGEAAADNMEGGDS